MGWEKVIVCNKCGYVSSLAFPPSICPKCASDFYDFGYVPGKSHKAIAKRTFFGWKFLNKNE